MTKLEYSEFLRRAEWMLDLFAGSPPARILPELDRLFVRKVIDGLRTMLEAQWPEATDAQRAEAKRLADRLDRIEEHHFLKP